MSEVRLLTALCMLFIWNPNLMDWIPEKQRRRQLRLFYKTMGIVQHDRALNGENMKIDQSPPLI